MARRSRAEKERYAREALEAVLELRADLEGELGDVEAMDLDELLSVLQSAGVDLDLDMLEAGARQAVGEANLVAYDRGNLSAAREQVLAEQVEAATRKVAARAARDTMRQLRDEAMFAADERPFEQRTYIWISVGEGSCPDCYELHGQVFPEDYWDDVGRPGSGNTFCGEHCRCRLFPVDATREEESERFEETRRDLVRSF